MNEIINLDIKPDQLNDGKTIQVVALPLNVSPKGVRTFEVPKSKYQIVKESNERWEFMEKLQ